MSRTSYSKELFELLNAPEGEHYEFKRAKSRFSFDEAAKYCCALANCGGGKLVLGVTDERPRTVVGSEAFEQPERTRRDLMEKLHIRIDFEILYHDDMRILVFIVASRPVGIAVQYEGVVWWRQGDSLVPMPQKILHNIYEESGHDFSSDICPGATMEDLDLDAINDFRRRWLDKSGNKRISNLTVEQLLLDCGAITDKGVTYAALILFGTRPALTEYLSQAEVVFEYRSSERPGKAQQREDFRVGFFTYYDRIWELINLRNDIQTYQDGLFVLDVLTFNERIVRESLLNAVSHRRYQHGGNIFIRQYRDRIEIESPGGLPLGISPDNIFRKQYRRNRRITDILALCGLIERSGQGMDLIYELSIRDAKPLPDFSGTDDHFVFLTLNSTIQDPKMILLIKEIGEETLGAFTTEDFLVIDALFYKKKLSSELRSRLKHLADIGLVTHKGYGNYSLSEKLCDAIGVSNSRIRLNKENRDTGKALILKHMKAAGENGLKITDLLREMPNYSRSQIKTLLQDLREEKKIFADGKANKARWLLS